jgi:hypothetical protein
MIVTGHCEIPFPVVDYGDYSPISPQGGVAVPTMVRKTFVFRSTLVTNVIEWQYHYLRGVLDMKRCVV